MALAAMASVEFGHFAPLRDRLAELGADPYAAMEPFAPGFDAFHAHTAPARLARGPGQGVRRRRAGRGLLPRDRGLRRRGHPRPDRRLLDDAGHSEFAVDRVRRAIEADHRVGGRLALWGRRLMGEALSQAQRVAAERDALTALLAGGVDRPGMDLAAIGRMFTRLTENHTEADDPARPRRLIVVSGGRGVAVDASVGAPGARSRTASCPERRRRRVGRTG